MATSTTGSFVQSQEEARLLGALAPRSHRPTMFWVDTQTRPPNPYMPPVLAWLCLVPSAVPGPQATVSAVSPALGPLCCTTDFLILFFSLSFYQLLPHPPSLPRPHGFSSSSPLSAIPGSSRDRAANERPNSFLRRSRKDIGAFRRPFRRPLARQETPPVRERSFGPGYNFSSFGVFCCSSRSSRSATPGASFHGTSEELFLLFSSIPG